MSTKTKVIICAVALVTSYAFGRFTAPTKIKVETKLVKEEKSTKDTSLDLNKKKKTIKKEIIRKDGTKEIITRTTEETNKNEEIKAKKDMVTKKESLKEVTKSSGYTSLSLLFGAPVDFTGAGAPDYGVSISTAVLGPITIGAFGFKSGLLGLSVGLQF